MKTLKQIQEENHRFIIMANNPTAKTYDEALEMELGFGCIISRYEIGMWGQLCTESFWRLDNFAINGITNEHDFIFTICGCQKLGQGFVEVDRETRLYPIGRTKNNIPAVSKVELLEETKKKFSSEWRRDRTQTIILGKPLTLSRVLIAFGRKSLDLWEDLEKETLEKQSEETQKKFNKLIK